MLSKVLRNTTPSLRALRQVTPVAKAFSSSPIAKAQGEITREPIETPLSLWNFTEEEDMIRQTGQLLYSLRLDQADEQCWRDGRMYQSEGFGDYRRELSEGFYQ